MKTAGARKHVIKVVRNQSDNNELSWVDAEMDVRATHAVRAAVSKAIVCKKPIGRYDKEQKRAYVEYANGERKYVD